MKKILLILLVVVIITGCGAEKEVLITNDSGLVGIWNMTDSKQSQKDDKIIENITFQFYEDGKCIYAYRFLTGTDKNIPFEGKTEGTCYLNTNSSKFKMTSESQNQLFNKWMNLKLDNSTLIIGNYTFTKTNE